ncbi:MAG: hypothetical protein HDT28_05010 [Clostridiales bacterium]|nr:hypothetical protein [Clostridiales bacterium]
MLVDFVLIVQRRLDACANRIRENITATGTRASGRTQASIRVEVSADTGTIYGRQAFSVLQTGRRGGRVPRGFVDMMKEWIREKGVRTTPIPYVRRPSAKWQPKYTPEQRGVNAAAGAIAYKIRTQGTSLYRQGGREDIYTEPIREAVEGVKADVKAAYVAEIVKDLRRLKDI